jgi:hypothetical protein
MPERHAEMAAKNSHESREAHKAFLTTAHNFQTFFSARMAEDFNTNVRNGLLHDGETRAGWLVRANARRGIHGRAPAWKEHSRRDLLDQVGMARTPYAGLLSTSRYNTELVLENWHRREVCGSSSSTRLHHSIPLRGRARRLPERVARQPCNHPRWWVAYRCACRERELCSLPP